MQMMIIVACSTSVNLRVFLSRGGSRVGSCGGPLGYCPVIYSLLWIIWVDPHVNGLWIHHCCYHTNLVTWSRQGGEEVELLHLPWSQWDLEISSTTAWYNLLIIISCAFFQDIPQEEHPSEEPPPFWPEGPPPLHLLMFNWKDLLQERDDGDLMKVRVRM